MPHDTSGFLEEPGAAKGCSLPAFYEQDLLFFFEGRPDAFAACKPC